MSAGRPGVAGIVLAGGRSARMGRPKAGLRWGRGTLLEGVVDAILPAVDEVVVVRAPGQDLPPLPAGVGVVDDRAPGRGPLEGVATGLAAVASRCDRALVVPVDLPFLTPVLARRLLAGLAGGAEVAAPARGGRARPLPAAYRTHLAPAARALLDAGERRLGALLDGRRVEALSADDLLDDPAVAAADPALRGVSDVDTPAEWAAAQSMRDIDTGSRTDDPSEAGP